MLLSVARVADGVAQGVGVFESNPVDVSGLNKYSVFANVAGTFTGDIYIEAAAKRGDAAIDNWFLIETSYQVLTNSTEILMDASVFSYSFIRVCVTIASGSATLTIDVTRKT